MTRHLHPLMDKPGQPLRNLLVVLLLVAFALRVYNLDKAPPGLFTDEAARGYDAFSIAHTGADMFGHYLPLFARGFDDYTPALYTYLTVPFVWLLDLSRFSTRLASVWIGVLTVAVAYQIIRRVFGLTAGLVGAALIGVSPWYVLLSRIGAEWNLLALGPMLTIALACRGLTRPRWLAAAGLAGGVSLYGYAPVKAFLPLLLLGFVVFYWPELRRQKQAAMVAALLLALLALPVYLFSFTPQGLTRFQEVASIYNLDSGVAVALFIKNYLAYFSPNFLFITDPSQPNVFFIQRLKQVGLLYWFELPLIVLGLVNLFRRGGRNRYFWLYWLLIAPLGINLHIHSPKPALWLTSTPTLHGLAGAGLSLLLTFWERGWGQPDRFKLKLQRGLLTVAAVGLAVLAAVNISAMVDDLFTEFPVYSAPVADWGYGTEQGIKDLVNLQPAFDDANLDTFGAISGIYLAFFSRYPPRQRQIEVATRGENAWQRVGPITIGAIETRSLAPGCHLTLTRIEKLARISAPGVTLATYPLPNGQPGPLVLGAIASPQAAWQPVEAVFGERILLHSYALASPKIKPGRAICLLLKWQSAGQLPADYTVFTHLLGPDKPSTGGPLWAQHDGPPADGRRPTSGWQPGELVADMHVLLIPDDAPPGRYQLVVGLYNAATGQRLPAQNGADAVTLTKFEIR